MHVDTRNREADAEPGAFRGPGPRRLLRHRSGRYAVTFVGYVPDGRPARAVPATGRTFAVTQTHWFRMAYGLVVEHWANRDDIGQATQLGWVPPSPLYRSG